MLDVTCQSCFYVGLMCILCAFYVRLVCQNLVFYVRGAFTYVRHIKPQSLLPLPKGLVAGLWK
jgi:hypothetical protein